MELRHLNDEADQAATAVQEEIREEWAARRAGRSVIRTWTCEALARLHRGLVRQRERAGFRHSTQRDERAAQLAVGVYWLRIVSRLPV